MFSENSLKCKYITQCSGCQIAHMDKSKQIDYKKNHFTDLWKKVFNEKPLIEFIRPVESHFRDRIDVTISNSSYHINDEEFSDLGSNPSTETFKSSIQNNQLRSEDKAIGEKSKNQKIGFYQKDSKDILDIEECPLSSPELAAVYKQVREITFPIKKGSLRLRVSPDNKSGLWIDFANEDIKYLLDEKTVLTKLSKIFDVIEIGQKRKKLSFINEQFKLTEPEQNIWFETYNKDLKPVHLKMNVGSFSQTGFTTNKALIEKLLVTLKTINHDQQIDLLNINTQDKHIKNDLDGTKKSNHKWLELCSGSGNLTIPLISSVGKVIATELDENAITSLKSTIESLGLVDSLQVERINIHKPSERLKVLLSGVTGVLADPPRSGLQGFLDIISQFNKKDLPKNFIYISCFADTLVDDLKTLKNIGYSVSKIVGIDQFPHSTHCEWLIHLTKTL